MNTLDKLYEEKQYFTDRKKTIYDKLSGRIDPVAQSYFRFLNEKIDGIETECESIQRIKDIKLRCFNLELRIEQRRK